MAITEFGKEARRQRIDRDLLLKDVAEGVGVTSTFLSAVESGRKPIPAGFVERIARAMNLTEEERKRLQRAADLSTNEHRLVVRDGASEAKRETASMLARNFDDLDEEQINRIREVFCRRTA